jgi:hypothetical protein
MRTIAIAKERGKGKRQRASFCAVMRERRAWQRGAKEVCVWGVGDGWFLAGGKRSQVLNWEQRQSGSVRQSGEPWKTRMRLH